MQHLEVSGAARPLESSLGVKRLSIIIRIGHKVRVGETDNEQDLVKKNTLKKKESLGTLRFK